MKRKFNLSIILVIYFSSALQAAETPPSPQKECIPRKSIFTNQIEMVKLSPNGSLLAYIKNEGEKKLSLCIMDLRLGTSRLIDVIKAGIHGVFFFQWAGDNRRIMFSIDSSGNENWALFSLDTSETKPKARKVVSFKGNQARILPPSSQCPDQLLILLNRDDPQTFDIYRLDLSANKMAFECKSPAGAVSWYLDDSMQWRGVRITHPDGKSELQIRQNKDSAWKPLVCFGIDEAAEIVAFGKEEHVVYTLHNLRTDTMALYRHDLQAGTETPLSQSGLGDITNIYFRSEDHIPTLMAFEYEKRQFHFLEDIFKADIAKLQESFGEGNFEIQNQFLDNPLWLIAVAAGDRPMTYHLYERGTKKITALFASRPDLEKWKLAAAKPLIIHSRDGLDMVGYLTLPNDSQGKPLPMILNVHGGPWERVKWGFDNIAQWGANRGYAVLNVNFRGSTGFGKKFLSAGNRQWGKKMLDDLIDAVRWAIDGGVAAPGKIAIFGASYGGYAVLAAAAYAPDTFACGVDLCGPADLCTFIRSIPPYWKPYSKMLYTRIGDPDSDEKILRESSPLYAADRMQLPLLIGQGKNDVRVNFLESRKMVSQLRLRKKEVTYLEFPDEGHGLKYDPNRLAYLAEAEAFLAGHLGGHLENASAEEAKILKKVRRD